MAEGFSSQPPERAQRYSHRAREDLERVPSSEPKRSAGILTCCASTTPFGLALAPDSPWDDSRCPGNLGFTAGRTLTCLFATYANILTSHRSTAPHDTASAQYERSPTPLPKRQAP